MRLNRTNDLVDGEADFDFRVHDNLTAYYMRINGGDWSKTMQLNHLCFFCFSFLFPAVLNFSVFL